MKIYSGSRCQSFTKNMSVLKHSVSEPFSLYDSPFFAKLVALMVRLNPAAALQSWIAVDVMSRMHLQNSPIDHDNIVALLWMAPRLG